MFKYVQPVYMQMENRIMSIWAFDMFVDTQMPTYKHTRARRGRLQSLDPCSALFGCGHLDM